MTFESDQLRNVLIKGIETVIRKIKESKQAMDIDEEELYFANQAIQFLRQNRTSRIDAGRHLNILLNSEV